MGHPVAENGCQTLASWRCKVLPMGYGMNKPVCRVWKIGLFVSINRFVWVDKPVDFGHEKHYPECATVGNPG